VSGKFLRLSGPCSRKCPSITSLGLAENLPSCDPRHFVQKRKSNTLYTVERTGKIVVVFSLLSLFAVPFMACLTPNGMATAEARECCRKMAEQCGEMGMPSSHSCCHPTVRESNPYLASSRVSVSTQHQAISADLAIAHNSLLTDVFHVQVLSNTHAPPESPPETISILRI
jgi:hypothetical protein